MMNLRIHGDNIIECERALHLIVLAYKATAIRKSNCIYMPSFDIILANKVIFHIELFAGHDRWNISIAKHLALNGAPLREAADAYITKLTNSKQEQICIAIEFCNALPAGNNAWQRSGRGIASAEIGIPYFYYAEIGGVELDEDRVAKAARFPNPIVPFSYLTASTSLNVICVPVYAAHPAITPALRHRFNTVFGLQDSLKLIKCLLEDTSTTKDLENLIKKGTDLVEILANDRKSIDTFKGNEWGDFLKISSVSSKVKWLKTNTKHLVWRKKQSDKVNVSTTFKQLLQDIQDIDCLSVGAKGIPICLVSEDKIKDLYRIFKKIYPKQNDLHKCFATYSKPLIIVWVTGFKPKGDDSRPDRGLVPLARMLFGNEIDILTIVYGPAKIRTWKLFDILPTKLAEDNGLWESVLGLSDFVFIDSATSLKGAMFHEVKRKLNKSNTPVVFDKASPTLDFSEQDTDTAIHSLFSNQLHKKIFESMCNPPGGDWSGVGVLDFKTNNEFRWTSLPRVSSVDGKRPDHVIQIIHQKEIVFLSIESKNYAKDLESNIGKRLIIYLNTLLSVPPTAQKLDNKDWEFYESIDIPLLLKHHKIYSGGAFIYKNDKELSDEMIRGGLDFIISLEFYPPNQRSILHLKVNSQTQFLVMLLTKLCDDFGGGLEIKIH